MLSRSSRARRAIAALTAGLLIAAGLIGVTAVAPTPASALVVGDQPMSANASSMWQTNNTVWALDVADNVVYAGGQFTAVRPPGVALNGAGTVTRNRIAAFNATTGALITSFNPNANGQVYDVEVSPNGQHLYVAGLFTTIGGVTRQRIARLNLPSGTVDTTWQANASGTVVTVAASNTSVYVGGDFTTIKGVARQRIARLNTTNGDVVTAFNASSDARIAESALSADGQYLLMGGENNTINGQQQGAIASLNPTTGALRPWAATGVIPRQAQGGCDSNATDIIISGSVAYATAEAANPGCWEGYYAANLADGSLIYNQHCLGGSVGLAVAHGWMYRASHNHDCSKNVGGYVGSNSASDFVWYRLQVHRLSDGRLGHWSPTTNGGAPGTSTNVGPQVIASDGTNIYTGGDFSSVNQQPQQGITRFTPNGGNSAPGVPTPPRVTATAAGTLKISVDGVRDNNDGEITMNLYRDGGTTPIATQTRETWPWSPAVYNFVDSGLTAGTSHTYRVAASDGSATSAQGPASPPVTVGWQNPPAYPAAVANAGSSAVHWRLGGSSSPQADASGNGNTGDIVGGVSTGQPGALTGNTAIATNGVDGFITSSAPVTPTAAFTNSVWFNTTTERGGAILGFSDAKTGVGLRDNRALYMENDGRVLFAIRRGNANNPGQSFVRSPGSYNDGQWHQATTVFNGTNNITLYMDGVMVATLNITQPIVPGAGYLRAGYMDLSRFYTVFGQNYDGAPHVLSYHWAGRIDEPSMHNTALSAAQVAALYASGAAHGTPLPPEQPNPGDPPPPPSPSGFPNAALADAPSLYWRLGELGGTSIADTSPNNRSGTFRTGLSFGLAGALTDTATAIQSGGSGIGYSNNQFTNPQTFSLETFLKTNANGGKILGLENAQTGWGTTFDRMMYLSSGRVFFGVRSGGVMHAISSPNPINDGQFHHLVATQGAGGMALYIDGALVASNAAVIAPDASNGYWRLGGGNLTGWPSAPAASAVNGVFDETAVYPTALSAARVQAHHLAATTAGTPPPAAPTNVQAPTVTGTTASLTWDVPAGTITDYRVFRNGALRGTSTTNGFNDTGLTSGQTYSYTVTARTADGESAPSAALLVTTPDTVAPSVPGNLQAPTVNVHQVVLTWNNSSDNVGIPTYEVWRDGSFLSAASTNTFTDTAVAANTSYSYTVRAKDAAGNFSAQSAARAVTTPLVGDTTVPSVPQNLRQTGITGASVNLAWNASTDDTGVTAYIVTRNGVDLPATALTSLTDSPLASGVTYTYTVRARDASGNTSAASAQLQVTTPDVVAPSVPGNLTAPSVSASSVQLSWNGSTDNVGVVAYDVRRNGTVIGSPATPGFTDNTVVTGQTYSYTVTARDAAGNSAVSSPLSVTAQNADPTLFTDLFGGTNGSTWGSGWTTSVGNGTATHQSGTGQLAFADVAGGYSRAQLTGLAARANSDTILSYRFNSTTAVAYLNVWARASGGWQNAYRPRTGYGLEMRPQSGTISVVENNNGAVTTLATVAGARQVSTAKQWLRLRVVGSTIQFKSWVDGQAEPAAWTSTVTDSTVSAAGQLHLSLARGASNVGAKNVQIDDLRILPG